MNAFREQPRRTESSDFQTKLLSAWAELHPEAANITIERQQELRADVQARDSVIDDHELRETLENFGVILEKLSLVKTIELFINGRYEGEQQIWRIPVRDHFHADRLPTGYGYKGGAARALLARALGNDVISPRDIDIVRFREESQPGMDNMLAEKYMPDDAATGHGVEHIENIDEYFRTRDLSINEVLATDTEIVATKQCILDTLRRIIRITPWERHQQKDNNYILSPKMLSKILRFYAESIYRYDEAHFADVDEWEFEEHFISPFWMALQLDRAYERGHQVAEHYVEQLKKFGRLPKNIVDADNAAAYLASLCQERPYYYRHAPAAQFSLEKSWADNEKIH
jgi:hypothetical protein